MDAKDIHERLRLVRKGQKLTQADFAHQLGVTPSYISAMELGKKEVTSKVIKRLLELFEVPSDWLFTGKTTNGNELSVLPFVHNSSYDSKDPEKWDVGGNEVRKGKNSPSAPTAGKKGSKAGAGGKLLSVQDMMAREYTPQEIQDDENRTRKRHELARLGNRHAVRLHKHLDAYLTQQAPHLHQLQEDTESLLTLIRTAEKVTGLYLQANFDTDTLVFDPTTRDLERLDLVEPEDFRARTVAALTERAPYAPAISRLVVALRAFLNETRPLDTDGVIGADLLTGTPEAETAPES